jgi:ATP-dependent Clp protease protease subunit
MLNNNMKKEFEKFATKHLGINSNLVETFTDGLTPYILEERELRATQIDVFSRLLRDRIIWVSGPVDQNMADIIQAQLLFLDNTGKEDITLYINSPGGSVMCGLGIVDLMNYISPDIATVNLGICASMSSILLSSGTKGKRSSLVYSKVMIHQVSSGSSGHIEDNRISQMEAEKYNYILFKILSKNTGRNFEEIIEGARRDHWLNSDEALKFGLIDEIIGLDKTPSISSHLEGFEDYYNREILKKF